MNTHKQNIEQKRILVVLAIVVIVFIGFKMRDTWSPSETSDAYKAVFLSNGQVFFGKLTGERSHQPVLTEVFYLQVTAPLSEKDPKNTQSPEDQIRLVKLGSEIHGPQNRIVLNRDHILFVEELRPDSEIIKAIADYK